MFLIAAESAQMGYIFLRLSIVYQFLRRTTFLQIEQSLTAPMIKKAGAGLDRCLPTGLDTHLCSVLLKILSPRSALTFLQRVNAAQI